MDTINAASGADTLTGAQGGDTMVAAQGADTLTGGQGGDTARTSDRVRVKALRSFGTPEGFKHPDSPPFEAERSFAAELFANDLVEYLDPETQSREKAARPARNKMSTQPANKKA